MAIDVKPGIVIPDDELQWRFSASGGPGGQHANRSNTRVELTWNIVDSTCITTTTRTRLIDRFGMELRVVSDDHRSQTRNRDAAARRLAERISSALVVQRPRRATKPSRGAKQRRMDAKRRTSQKKQMRGRPGNDDY